MKFFTSSAIYKLVMLVMLCNIVNCELLQYFQSVGSFFGYGKKKSEPNDHDMIAQRIPYEVAVTDEKFISEAAKLTGVALSELDSCQHRVILKLQTSCDKMNDEEIAKLAVMLLNCQSFVEGRKIYPCTESMSIKDCTSNMDADTWNSYHLMSNRARAVCYSVRQTQFRGLTEHTINRLMDAARNQLFSLDKIGKDQQSLHDITRLSLTTVKEGQEELFKQQKDLQMAQLHGQLALEDNIRRISEEKRLILETHSRFKKMTEDVQEKLDDAFDQLLENGQTSSSNHKELMDDLIAIQNKAQVIFQRIDESSKLLIRQNEILQRQYESTFAQLSEVNSTVHYLVSLVGGTKKVLEEQIEWLSAALGGTDLAIEKLCTIMWHFVFVVLAMVASAFLNASNIMRLIVTVLPTLNLALKLQESYYSMNFVHLCIAVASFLICHFVFLILTTFKKSIISGMIKGMPMQTPKKETLEKDVDANCNSDTFQIYDPNINLHPNYETDSFEFQSPSNGSYLPRSRSRTPLTLNGITKTPCGAKTRAGTPCKLRSMPGREFCSRHQGGDSIFAG